MPSRPRKVSRTNVYHVMLRGVNRQRIFEEPADYERFLFYLASAKSTYGFKLLAYCLMNNHVHLLIKEMDDPLSKIIRQVSAKYALWFNQKYDRCGHLFQDRFKSSPVESDSYFITVLIYIYQNPLKAELCTRSEDYRWSSRRLLGKSGMVDELELLTIVSIESILEKENEELIEKLSKPKIGRKLALSDDVAFALMKELSSVESVSGFQLLDSARQIEVFEELQRRGVSIRQFARLSGLGRGLIQRW